MEIASPPAAARSLGAAILAAVLPSCHAAAAAPAGAGGAEARVEAYRLAVALDPERGSLAARARVTLRARAPLEGTVTCFLNERLRLISGGARPGGPRRRLFAPAGAPVAAALPAAVEAGDTFEVVLEYEGPLSGSTASLYGITPRLTELSAYGAWFPAFEGADQFRYEMTVEAPETQQVLSNGRLVEERVSGGRRVVRFDGLTAARDLVLIASDALRTARVSDSLTIAHLGLGDDQAAGLAEQMTWILAFYRDRFGPPPAGPRAPVTVAALPRGGGSYARPPLIVLDASQPELWTAAGPLAGQAEFHRRAHEAAHLLWPWADSATPDDWLNEGLAEYAALLASTARFGPDRGRELVRGCRRRVLSLARPRAIVETLRTDPWGEALFYDKGALILRMLEDRLRPPSGAPAGGALEGVLRAYRALERPTTDDLEALASQAAGSSMASFFDTWVRSAAVPRLDLSLLEVRPAGGEDGAEGLLLRGAVGASPELPAGTLVTVSALGAARRHDVRVEARGASSPFDALIPFYPDDVALDPDLILLHEDATFRRDLLAQAREERAAALMADGQAAEERRQHERALELYLRAGSLAPRDMLPWYRAGRVCAALGDHESALRHHREAAAADGRHLELRSWNQVRIGQALASMRKGRAARAAFRAALLEPDYAGAHEAARRGSERP